MPRCSNNLTTFLILASASVSLACGGSDVAAPTTGTIAVTVTSTGADIDPDGYQLSVDGGTPRDILANGTAKWTGSPGVHTLALSGLAFNCDITAAPTSADVALGRSRWPIHHRRGANRRWVERDLPAGSLRQVAFDAHQPGDAGWRSRVVS